MNVAIKPEQVRPCPPHAPEHPPAPHAPALAKPLPDSAREGIGTDHFRGPAIEARIDRSPPVQIQAYHLVRRNLARTSGYIKGCTEHCTVQATKPLPPIQAPWPVVWVPIAALIVGFSLGALAVARLTAMKPKRKIRRSSR